MNKIISFNNKTFITFVAFFISVVIIYLAFPLFDETLNTWDGEICETVLDNISFNKRVANFYIVLLSMFPLLFILIRTILSFFIKYDLIENLLSHIDSISIQSYFFSLIVSLSVCYFFYTLRFPQIEKKSLNISSIISSFTSINFRFEYSLFIILFIFLFFITLQLIRRNIVFIQKNIIEITILNAPALLIIILGYIHKTFSLSEKVLDAISLFDLSTYISIFLLLYISILISQLFFSLNSLFFLNFTKTIALLIILIINVHIFINNIILSSIISIFLLLIIEIYTNHSFSNGAKKDSFITNRIEMSFALFPLIWCISYEIIFCLREYVKFSVDIIIANLLIALIYILCLAIFSFFYRKKKILNDNTFITISFLSILFFVFFNVKNQYIFDYRDYANVFELGNNTVAYDTLVLGKVPFADYFSAHALTDIWTHILYALIHNNLLGLFLSPYDGLIELLGCIVTFLLLKEIFDIKFSFLIMVFFPVFTVGLKISTFNLISILLLLYIIKCFSISRVIIFWTVTLLNALYLYDAGISLGVASILTYILYCIYNRNNKSLIIFLTAGALIGFSFLLFISLYLSFNGIDVIKRFFEWKSLTLNSFMSLTHTNIGDYNSLQYIVSYFVMPSFAVLSLAIVLIDMFGNKKQNKFTYIIILFSISQILYISRGIAFHNYFVCHGKTGVLYNYTLWTISLFFSYWKYNANNVVNDNKYIQHFILSAITIVFIVSIFLTHSFINQDSSLVGKVVYGQNKKYNIPYEINYKQVISSTDSEKFYNQFKDIFDYLLEDSETFIDFANVTSIYAYSNRVRPVYISQSPGLLSDLYSQKCFIDEIKKYKVPLAVLGNSDKNFVQHIYDVQHNIRYYTIAEYIYRLYRPLVMVDETVIWCLKDKYNEYSLILQDKGYDVIDYGYDSNIIDGGEIKYNYGHEYNIKYLPYIMGMYYDRLYGKTDIITEVFQHGDLYKLDCSHNSNKTYFLVCDIENETHNDIDCSTILYDNNNYATSFKYNFNVKVGMNRYIFRISQDYLLTYNSDIDTIKFDGIINSNIKNIFLIEKKQEY